ncbi:hypothetical protein Hdeb2414_s0001g00023001 [Helianthus debilis subsp. tardiflorus]
MNPWTLTLPLSLRRHRLRLSLWSQTHNPDLHLFHETPDDHDGQGAFAGDTSSAARQGSSGSNTLPSDHLSVFEPVQPDVAPVESESVTGPRAEQLQGGEPRAKRIRRSKGADLRRLRWWTARG